MDQAAHRAKVLQLFEKHRMTPGAPYDESHFLDSLLPAPEGKRAVFNSFRGLRRYNAFIEEVQYEFAICFSVDDRDANYPLAGFIDRIIELERSRRGSLASLRNQARAGPEWQVLVIGNLLLLVAAAWLKNSTWPPIAAAGLAVVFNAWFFRLKSRARAYHLKLLSRIEDLEKRA